MTPGGGFKPHLTDFGFLMITVLEVYSPMSYSAWLIGYFPFGRVRRHSLWTGFEKVDGVECLNHRGARDVCVSVGGRELSNLLDSIWRSYGRLRDYLFWFEFLFYKGCTIIIWMCRSINTKALTAFLFVAFLAGSMCVYIGFNGHHATGGPVSGHSAPGPIQCGAVNADRAVLQAGLTSAPLNVTVLALVLYIFFIPTSPVFSFYHPPKY